jgi:hypothetical protein
MTPRQPRYPRRAIAPLPQACEHLTRLVYELLARAGKLPGIVDHSAPPHRKHGRR